MVTEIPVFLNLTREISLSDFVNKLQTCGLGEITPYEAVYLDKDHYKNCFAFNVEGANQDDILRKLQQILSLDMGHIDIEYEWFLRQSSSKIAIKGKYVNECHTRGGVVDDEVYLSQIIAIVD